MTQRKGELTPAGVDRGWPHQVILLASLSLGKLGAEQAEFCKGLSLCVRRHSISHKDEHYLVHCFSLREDAATFMARYGGEWFDPRERGKGLHWNKWLKASPTKNHAASGRA